MIIGIDPGLSGAIAFLTQEGQFVEVLDMPIFEFYGKQAFIKNVINARAIADQIRMRTDLKKAIVFLEASRAMPDQGVSSVFSTGHTAGSLHAILAVLEVPMIVVQPNEWKKYFQISKDKEIARAKVVTLYPDAAPFLERKKDHNRAEAILIAIYGRERHVAEGRRPAQNGLFV